MTPQHRSCWRTSTSGKAAGSAFISNGHRQDRLAGGAVWDPDRLGSPFNKVPYGECS